MDLREAIFFAAGAFTWASTSGFLVKASPKYWQTLVIVWLIILAFFYAWVHGLAFGVGG